MSDIGDWYKRIPFFTRWWLTLTVVFSLAGRMGLVKPQQMILLYAPFMNNFEVRVTTNSFLYRKIKDRHRIIIRHYS